MLLTKRNRPLVCILLLAIAVATGCDGKGDGKAPPAVRAVVLVTVEGLGRQTLQANADSAPVLAALAARPENAAKAYTPCPLLLPATISIMTGAAPRTHRVLDVLNRHAPPDLPTLAESFRDNGWSTAAVVASPLVSRGSGLARGFDVFDSAPGYSIGTLRYYPQTRPAGEIIGNAVRWLEALPVQGRSGFLWLELSDLARAYDTKLGPIDQQAKSRIEALDDAVGRVRDALRTSGIGASVLVVTADRGQLLGELGDLDGGFFLEPAAIEVPLLVESIESSEGSGTASAPVRPIGLTGVAHYLSELAGLSKSAMPAPAVDPVIAVSASAWVSFRWSPAVALVEGDTLWLFDGVWRRFAGTSASAEIAEAEVPAALAERARAIVAELASGPVGGPAAMAATAAARKAGLELPSKPFTKTTKTTTPTPSARHATVASLQAARAHEALNRPMDAIAGYRSLLADTHPPLAALADLTFLQASNTSSSEPTWKSATQLLKIYGLDRMALHPAAHAANAHGERALGEAFLLAYLEEVRDEPDALYDLACIASLRGDLPEAQAYLERAIEAGFVWWPMMEQDADLRSLRASPGFATVMKKHGR